MPLDLNEDHPGRVTGLLDGREERNMSFGAGRPCSKPDLC